MQYALEGSIAVAGAGISWLKDKLQLLENADECETLAASVPHTAGKPLSTLQPPFNMHCCHILQQGCSSCAACG